MKKRILSITLVLALMLSVLSGCGPAAGEKKANEASGEKIPMTIAFCTWAGYAPLFIAKEKGYFDEAGIDANIVIMEDESTYGAAFVSDSIQGLGQVLDRDIIQFNAGAPEQYVCTMDASTGGDGIVATADIKTMDDLAGKTVALDKSATSYFFFLQALQDSNIKEEDINIVEMGNDEAGEAFLAGNVDAAVTWEPALSSCGDREGGHKLVTSADYPKAIIDVLTVGKGLAEKHPDIYEKLADCWYKSVDYVESNFDDACVIMGKGLDLDPEEVKAECAGITFYNKKMNEEFNDLSKPGNVKEIAEMAAGFWVEKGYMDNAKLDDFFPTLK